MDQEPEPAVASGREPPNPESTSWVWFTGAIVLIFVGFLILDVILPLFFEDENFFWVVLLNVVVAQLTLLCIWGTLVEGTFLIRIPWTILLLVISWAALAYGVYLQQGAMKLSLIHI